MTSRLDVLVITDWVWSQVSAASRSNTFNGKCDSVQTLTYSGSIFYIICINVDFSSLANWVQVYNLSQTDRLVQHILRLFLNFVLYIFHKLTDKYMPEFTYSWFLSDSLLMLSHLFDAFWRICSRQLLKTLWQKKKLLKTSNLSFLQQCFQLFLIIKLSFMEMFHILYSKSSAADLLYVVKG